MALSGYVVHGVERNGSRLCGSSTKDSRNITVREGSEFCTLVSTLDSYEKPVGGDDSAGYFRSGN